MRHRTVAAAAIALATLGLLSCDHSATAPRLDQLTLDVVSGNGQTGVVGTQLAPLVVKVTSAGNPVAGQILNFRVVAGGGNVYGGTELSDNDGIAQELWTLGTSTAVEQKVEVRAVESSTGAAKVFASFTATALPGPAAQIVIQAGNGQTAHPLSPVPIAPAVQVADQYGNPVNLPNVTVNFVPDDAGGRVTNGRATTAPNGIATVGSWTLGSTCGGTNTLTATASGNGIAGNPATFTARAGDCWTTQASMPTARTLLGVAASNGILYAVGGANSSSNPGNGLLTTLEAYDPTTDTWTTKAPMPTPRYGPGAVVINGILYAVGGYDGISVATVEAYDPATDTWTTKAPMPTARHVFGIAVINGILYAVGGYSDHTVATVEAYNPATDTWTTKAPMPTPRYGLGVAASNGILYAVGGSQTCDGCNNLTTVEAYDPVTDTWTTKASMPTARYHLGAAAINGILYAVGGNNQSGYQATVEAYHPATDTWTTKASMLTPRYQLGVAAINGIVYAVGGSNGNVVATNEAYHP